MCMENENSGVSENIPNQNIPQKLDFELEEGELEELTKLLNEIENKKNYKYVSIRRTRINQSSNKMDILLDDPLNELEKRHLDSKLTYNLIPISKCNADKERGYLKEEYDYEHGIGQHWDNLRWNVSRFFLGIQTVFAIASLQGILGLSKKDTIEKPELIIWGLLILSMFNIVVCIIWCLRNLGIHSWHRAAIRRQRLIELDPRWKHIPWFNSGVRNIMTNRFSRITQRFPRIIQSTGWLECWGPPLGFILFWLGIIILVCVKCRNI